MIILPGLAPLTNEEVFKEGSEEALIAALEKELEDKVHKLQRTCGVSGNILEHFPNRHRTHPYGTGNGAIL